MRAEWRQAFTLIELLVVIAIIAVLAGLTLGIVGSSNQRALRSETEALMNTVTAAINRYQQEVGGLPLATGQRDTPFADDSWTTWYPQNDDEGWQRQALWWRLSQGMDQEATRAARQAADAAWGEADPVHERQEYSHLWRNNELREDKMDWLQDVFNTVDDAVVADLHGPGASDGWWAGSGSHPDFDTPKWGKTKVKLRGLAKMEWLRLRGMRAKRMAERSWCSLDLLGASDVKARHIDGDQLLDAWGNPLGYISFADAGIAGRDKRNSNHAYIILPVQLAPAGRATLTDRNGDGIVDEEDLRIEPPEDERIDRNGDGVIDRRDWGSLLWNALPGYERGFVLLSAGPDGRWPLCWGDEGSEDDLLQRGGIE